MKKLISIVLVLMCFGVKSQNTNSSVKLSYSSSVTGNHLRIGYQTSFSAESKWTLGGGIKYLLYVDNYNPEREVYTGRFYGESVGQNFGLYVEGSREVFTLPENNKMYVKFDAQINKTGVKSEYYTIVRIDGDEYDIVLVDYQTDPFLNLETTFALGLDAKLASNLAFFIEGGLGVAFVFDVPEPLYDDFEWIASPMLNTGIRYQF